MATAVVALQAALAAEQAAVYGYGVAGAHLSGASQATAQQYWTAHRKARDTLTAMITARGATPVAALAYYDLPFPVTSVASAEALAAHLEDGVTAAYLDLVAVSDASLRTFGALATQNAAGRAAHWRGSTIPFPGLPAGLPAVATVMCVPGGAGSRWRGRRLVASRRGALRLGRGQSCSPPRQRRRRRQSARPTTTKTTTGHPCRSPHTRSPQALWRPDSPRRGWGRAPAAPSAMLQIRDETIHRPVFPDTLPSARLPPSSPVTDWSHPKTKCCRPFQHDAACEIVQRTSRN